MLYGASPSGLWQDVANTGLKPVMTLSSEIIAVQNLKAGEAVGYGATWRTAEGGVSASLPAAMLMVTRGWRRAVRRCWLTAYAP